MRMTSEVIKDRDDWREKLQTYWVIESSFWDELRSKGLIGLIGTHEVTTALAVNDICSVTSFVNDGTSVLIALRFKWATFYHEGMSM